MSDLDPIARMRHDLANPLSAILAEIQLLLLGDADLPEEVRESLKIIETQALRMRAMIRE